MRKVPISRRSTFTPRLASQVLRRIAEGETLSKICGPKRKKGMPSRLTVYNWLSRYENFRRAYMLARMAQSELYADEVIEIADGTPESAERALKIEVLRRDRLRVEARRWRAAVLAPELYVRRLALAEAAAPMEEERPKLTDRELAARVTALLEEVGPLTEEELEAGRAGL